MIKALFFDIDGTLVSFRTHKIPRSTVEAITMAKNMGIKVYISTGRPRQLIDNINEISHLVDGYITVNGAYCFEEEEIISFHPESVLGQSVLQLTPVISQEDEELIMRSLPDCTSCRWHPDFADITMKSADKGMGFSAIIARHSIKPEETMAFGDGGNDMSIIRKAGIGVAMGNANEPLKNAADYITDSVDEDGIYKALERWIFH